jgi:hypothetical protein
VSAGSSSPGLNGSPTLPNAPPPAPKSRAPWAAAAAVVLVAALIVGLGFANVIPGFHLGKSSSSSPSGPPKYTVAFYEDTLPLGVYWAITLNTSTAYSYGYYVNFTVPNGTYDFSVGAVAGYSASPASGSVTVSGATVVKTVVYTPATPGIYTVWFNESGLPVGTNWSVTLGTTTHYSTATPISFLEANGTYSYSIGIVAGYSPNSSSGSIHVAGSDLVESLTFSPVLYDVTFNETGLPASLTWGVTLGGTHKTLTTDGATDSLVFSERNGTHAYSVDVVPGWTQSSLPATGSVVVDGAAVYEATLTYVAATYNVTFSESGITSADPWSATLIGFGTQNGTAPSSIVFNGVPNGTYDFSVGAAGYAATPPSGQVTVAGTNVTQSISFGPYTPAPTYNVTFNETGLPAGAVFSIFVGITVTSLFEEAGAAPTLVASLPNGTYGWSAHSNNSSYTSPSLAGTFTVAGAPLTETVAFTAVVPTAQNYSVTFTEDGLPTGYAWNVSVNGTVHNATGTSVSLDLPNGTYTYAALAVGYSAGTIYNTYQVVVDGAAVSIPLYFNATSTVTFTEAGLGVGVFFWQIYIGNFSVGTNPPADIAFELTNGSYNYSVGLVSGYLPTVASGQFTVAGRALAIGVEFVPNPWYVTFVETGLPTNTTWGADLLAGTSLGAGGGTNLTQFNVSVPNGTYEWFLFSLGPEVGNPAAGTVTMAGANVTVHVKFVNESGGHLVEFYDLATFDPGDGSFPSGGSWTVTLGNQTVTTTGSIAELYVPNGTYNFSVTPPPGYVAAPSSGTLTVNGTASPGVPNAAVGVYFGPTGGPFLPAGVHSALAPRGAWARGEALGPLPALAMASGRATE